MRLQPALSIHEFEGFEGPEEREARKAQRQARRAVRKKKKLARIRRKTRKLEQEARRPSRSGKRGRKRASGGGGGGAPVMQPAPQSWEQEPQGWDEPQLEPAPSSFAPEDPEILDAEWAELDAEMDQELEGIGAFKPFQALQKVQPLQRLRQRAQARRAAGGWGPSVRMGRNLRIQAASGHRAAVIDLKPGLYLVAELPEAVTRTEFGIAPLLAPLMVKAAKKAIDEGKKPPEKRGPLAALFTKKVRERQAQQGPIRLFRAREAQAATPADAPKQLTGPVAPGLQPAPGAGWGRTFLRPAPTVGWADDQDVAEMLGCEACEDGWR